MLQSSKGGDHYCEFVALKASIRAFLDCAFGDFLFFFLFGCKEMLGYSYV